MAEYSIRDLENFTNIKAHTLRIWEQRYQLLTPERTETNIRTYSDKDLKKILNINLLYNHGFKISRIAAMSDAEIIRLATDILQEGKGDSDEQIQFFIKHIIELDEEEIRKGLNNLNQEMGTERLYTSVMIPLLQKIGELWQVDTISVSHEHFFSNILREFMVVQIDRLAAPAEIRAKAVLFLHEREMHELSLLFYHYFLKKNGYDCVYLGQNVPVKDLERIVRQWGPEFLVTSLIAEAEESFVTAYFSKLLETISADHLYIGGFQTQRFHSALPEKAHIIQDLADLKRYFV